MSSFRRLGRFVECVGVERKTGALFRTLNTNQLKIVAIVGDGVDAVVVAVFPL